MVALQRASLLSTGWYHDQLKNVSKLGTLSLCSLSYKMEYNTLIVTHFRALWVLWVI